MNTEEEGGRGGGGWGHAVGFRFVTPMYTVTIYGEK